MRELSQVVRARHRAAVLVAVFDASVAAVAAATPKRAKITRIEPLGMAPDDVDAHCRNDWAVVVVAARSYAALRAAWPVLLSLGKAREVVIAIDESAPTGRVAAGALCDPSLPAVISVEMAASLESPRTLVRASFSAPAAVRTVIGDVLGGIELHRRVLRSAGLRPALQEWAAAAWTAGDWSAHTTANAEVAWGKDSSISPYVVTVAAAAGDGRPDTPHLDVSARCPPVDVVVVNPQGFRASGASGVGELIATRSDRALTLRVVKDGADLVVLPADGLLSYGEIARLRDLTHVDATKLPDVPATVAAGLFAQLAAAAVPTVTGRIRPEVRQLLHPDLIRELELIDVPAVNDPVGREVVAVRARRAALRRHSQAAEWRQLRCSAELGTVPEPTVSVVLATRRAAYLRTALLEIAAQDYPSVEIVVGLHGIEPSELTNALDGITRAVQVVHCPPGMPLGNVLNECTARASGEFVAKMDDDDWYGPHHLTDLMLAMEYSSATLVGTHAEFIYLADVDLTVRRLPRHGYEHYTGYVAGPTMLIRRGDLSAVGGWGPTPRAVDRSLLRAVSSVGGGIYRVHGLGFMLCRHGEGHSWNQPADYFLRSASDRWPGFHAAPELDAHGARARYDLVRSLRAETAGPTGQR